MIHIIGLIWFQNYLKTFFQSLSFCTSSRAAFQLVMRNLLRVVVLDSVTDFLLLLGKLVVVLLCGSTSYLAFHGHIPEVRLSQKNITLPRPRDKVFCKRITLTDW